MGTYGPQNVIYARHTPTLGNLEIPVLPTVWAAGINQSVHNTRRAQTAPTKRGGPELEPSLGRRSNSVINYNTLD